MAIPPLNQYGFVEIGTHLCTMAEIKQRFLNNEQRRQLWRKFETLVSYFEKMNCFAAFEFYGSFFTDKEIPGDIDVALEFSSKDKAPNVDNLIFDKEYFKLNYETDIVLKEPKNEAYKLLVPDGYTFTSKSLYTFRRLKPLEVQSIARQLRRPPFEIWQDEFKGILRVELLDVN